MDPPQPTLFSPQRRKACVPCTRAKRRCDKSLPACQRCVEKDVCCRYPSIRPYARREVPLSNTAERPKSDPRDSLLQSTIEQAGVLVPEPLEIAHNSSAGRDYSGDEPPTLDFNSPVNNDIQATTSSWFLRTETWAIDHSYPDPHDSPSIRLSDLKRFIQTVRRWLLHWIRENHCPFMHGQLYTDLGLPLCLLDAYAAVIVYQSKNEKNEEVIMSIIEEKANKLLNQQLSLADSDVEGMPPLRTAEHLARVQALFIYQFIRLFDGDIQQRAQAERHIPTLIEWNSKLWESANLDACLQTSFGFGGLFSQNLSNGRHYEPSGRPWRDWLVAESIRRIWLIGNYVQCVYLAMRDGQAACVGGIAFTARRGLWEAPSAATWTQLVRSKDPLFVPCLQTHRIIRSVSAPEIDVFCLSIISIM